MKIRIEVSIFSSGEKATLYTIQLPSQPKSETARFFDRFLAQVNQASTPRLRESLTIILDYLARICRLDGAQERFFRPREGRGLALPIEKGALRLYCYRLSDEALILCGGGVKTGQTIQQSPDCLPHFNLMNSVIDELKRLKISPADLPHEPGQVLLLHIVPPTDYHATH